MKKEEMFNLIGEADEQKVADAGTASTKRKMAPWLKWTTAAACLCLVISCVSFTQPSFTQPSKENISSSQPGSVQIANPYVTCESAQDMYDQAGFEIVLPAQFPDWITEIVYRAMPDKLIEVVYCGEDNEIRVRAAVGSDNISGIYDTSADTEKDMEINGKTVHVKGNADGENLQVLVCTWTADGKTYSVTSTNGVAEDVMQEIIAQIQ